MKNFCVFLLYLFVWSAFSQNLHDDANAASILNEADAATGWNSNANITSSTDNPFSGNFCLRVAATALNARDMSYTFNAVVGQQYQISIWARQGDFSFSPAFANWTGFQGFATTAITGTVWTEYTWTLTATNSSPLIRVYTAPYSGWQVGHEAFIDNVSIFVADSQSPSSPSNLVASNVTSTSLDLGWTASTDNIGVVDYEVFQDGQSIGFSAGALSFPVGNLAAGTEYSFTVVALDAVGNASAASNSLLVTTSAASDVTPPTAPTNLISSNVTATSLDLGWTAATDNVGVVDYEVFQDGQSIGFSGGALGFSVDNLTEQTEYSFTVVAIDEAGNTSPASSELLATTLSAIDVTPPTAPTNLISSNVTSTSLDLGWTAAIDNVGVVDYEVFQDGQSIGFSDGALSFSVGSLTEETEYSFTVLALDEAGNTSVVSVALLVTTLPLPDTIAPTSPTGLIASNISTNSFDLSWTASTDDVGVVDYEVFRDGQSIGLSDGDLTFLVGNLTANTEYSFTVVAFDLAGNASPSSTELLVTTLESSDVTPPSAPTGLISSNITASSFDLGWTASTDDVGVVDYEVFRDGQSLGFSSGVLSFSVSGLAPETEYAITVVALDAAGNVSVSSTELLVTTSALPDTTAPTSPTNLVASNVTTTGLALGWTASTDDFGVVDYEIFQDGQSIGFSAGSLIFLVGSLAPNTEYGFTVTALDAAGNVSLSSVELLVTTLPLPDTTPPTAPSGLFANNISASGLDLGWIGSTDDVGVVNYEVFRDGQSIGFSNGALSFSIGGLTAETEYGFTVVALDAAGNSSVASSELLVTTSVNSIDYTSLNANLDTVDWIGRDLFAARNIGIGTTNTQGYRLAVAGNMIAEEVRVALQASWPDYVFDSTYKLPSLLEVKKHIEEKGHLINVPSKSEVQEQGIGLGEMNAVLLEKIEELTLYILQQEQRIQELEKTVKELKN